MPSSRTTHAVPDSGSGSRLRLRYLGVDTYQHHVLFVRNDCPICQSQGFTVQSRVEVRLGGKSIIATVNAVRSQLLHHGEASLSEAAWQALGARSGDSIQLSLVAPLTSLSHLRSKVYGGRLNDAAMLDIVRDIAQGRYSDLHLSSFVTACAGDRLDLAETTGLTRAMIAVGERIEWPREMVLDKHCVGGLPGNRTTPIVVAIAAAHGLCIPKTSSRAITSPAGTADVMEMLAPVDLDAAAMHRVVDQEGGCVVWGGAARLSPADDVLVQVERPLELDSEGQLVASVLSKKASAGATHVAIDIPMGPTAKVRSREAADFLSRRLVEVGRDVGLAVSVMVTDGSQPVGRGIGPALEALDVLGVLRRDAWAPADLRERALSIAGLVLELAGVAAGQGRAKAAALLASGAAWHKFQAICEAQGGLREPPRARHTHAVESAHDGVVLRIDNRRLARTARLAGAPQAPAAGLEFLAPLGQRVEKGQPLFILHADAPGVLRYALEYMAGQPDIVSIGEPA